MSGFNLARWAFALGVLLVTSADAADKTIPQLEAEAGSVWDAAHEKKRPARTPKERQEVEELFGKVEALVKANSFKPKAVAHALRLPIDFKKTASNDHFSTYEAAIAAGSIRTVEIRVQSDAKSGLAILKTDATLGITPGEVRDRFGENARILPPSIHAPQDSPYCYLYTRPGGELRVCFKPIGAHSMESFVWDSNPL